MLPTIAAAIALSKSPVVTFCGGEPLVVSNIADIATILRGARKTTLLNTNAHLARRHTYERLISSFDIIGVSLDAGSEDLYTTMRGRGSNFQQAVAFATRVAESGRTKLKIATVVSRVNLSGLEELASLVRSLSANVWRLYMYVERGPVNSGSHRHALDRITFHRAMEQLRRSNRDLAISVADERSGAGCFIVAPTGDVLRPGGRKYTVIGSCMHTPLDEIWRNANWRLVENNKRWLQELDSMHQPPISSEERVTRPSGV